MDEKGSLNFCKLKKKVYNKDVSGIINKSYMVDTSMSEQFCQYKTKMIFKVKSLNLLFLLGL